MIKSWTKYTYACDPNECDSLIEFTCKDDFGFPSGSVTNITCPCGRVPNLLSVEPATILPTQQKEEEMQTTQTYDETKIAELEEIISRQNSALTTHQNCDYWKSENGRIQSQIIELIHSSYAEETEASEILVSLAEIIDYNPVKEIQFTATMHFTGRIEVPMSEAEDFDLSSVLEDAYVDINNGDVVIDNYELYDAEEC